MAGTSRSYNQNCALAMALDLVGERWSILIIRELLGAPARFGQLKEALPGVASNLLSARLRELENAGIVHRPTQLGGTSYALTDLGAALRPALNELGKWGARAGPVPTSTHQPIQTARSLALGLEAILNTTDRSTESLTIELHVDDETLIIQLDSPAKRSVRYGIPEHADAAAETTKLVLSDLPRVGLPPNGIRYVSGDVTAVEQLKVLLFSAIDAMKGPNSFPG